MILNRNQYITLITFFVWMSGANFGIYITSEGSSLGSILLCVGGIALAFAFAALCTYEHGTKTRNQRN